MPNSNGPVYPSPGDENRLAKLAKAVLGGEADLDDARQDAALRELVSKNQARPVSPGKRFWTLRSTVSNSIRRRQRCLARDHKSQTLHGKDCYPDTAHEVLVQDRRAQLIRAVQSLGPNHANVLMEHYFEDRPLCEIASDTGQVESTVRGRHHEAIKALRRYLSIYTPGGKEAWRLNLAATASPAVTTESTIPDLENRTSRTNQMRSRAPGRSSKLVALGLCGLVLTAIGSRVSLRSAVPTTLAGTLSRDRVQAVDLHPSITKSKSLGATTIPSITPTPAVPGMENSDRAASIINFPAADPVESNGGEVTSAAEPKAESPATPTAARDWSFLGTGLSWEVIEAKITSRKYIGFDVGAMRRGETMILAYQSGRWSSGHKRITESPDESKGTEERLCICDSSLEAPKDILTMVPVSTRVNPYIWRAGKNYDKIILRINDPGQTYADTRDQGVHQGVRYLLCIGRIRRSP